MKTRTYLLRFFHVVSLSLIFPISSFMFFSAAIVEAQDSNFVWAKSMGGTIDDYGNGISIDTFGNVYIVGSFYGTVDFDPGAETYYLTSRGSSDIFITKLDNRGNFVWAKSMGGTSFDHGYGIFVDTSGNVYTTGKFYGTVDFDPGPETYFLSGSSIFISKLNSSGNFIMAKAMGGTSGSVGRSISVDTSGNVYTTGEFIFTADFDPGEETYNLTSSGGNNDIFISKLNSNGNFIWARAVGGTSTDYGSSISTDVSGNVYTTGSFYGTADFDPGAGTYNLTSAGNYDIFINKLDSSGNFVWTRAIGGVSGDHGFGLSIDTSGNVYTTGSFHFTVDFDPGAGTFYLSSAGISDIFVNKLDSGGNLIWARAMGGTSSDSGSGIYVDTSGDVYTTGSFNGSVDFDPGVGTYNLTSVGNSDIFVDKLDSNGNFVWARAMGGTLHDYGLSISVDTSGNAYTTGIFYGTADFDPGAGTFNLTSAGEGDTFISKLSGLETFPWFMFIPSVIKGGVQP